MPLPRVAIVGRPNVGKSSLLNMLAREKISIVDPTPGTTRDRVSIIVELTPPDEGADSVKKITCEVTDTGGFGVYVTEGNRFNEVGADLSTLTGDIEHQISEAVRGADLVLLVLDTQAGVTPIDEEIARMLRERVLGDKGTRAAKGASRGNTPKKSKKVTEENDGPMPRQRKIRVQVVCNKCDGPKWESHAIEAASLGFGDPLPVSAKNNYFRRDFLDMLYTQLKKLPMVQVGKPDREEEPIMKLAIIGKRNAGKSSLVNALAGEQRVIVSEIAGTTRDAVDVRFVMDGKPFLAIDTAGLRKKKSFQDRIEWFAFDRAKRSVERADVVLLLIDGTEEISQVDQQLAMIAQKSFKPVVLVVNKWDQVQDRTAIRGKHKGEVVDPEAYEEYLRKEFKGLLFAPMSFISASEKTNLKPTIKLAFDLHNQTRQRITTGKLNRLLKKILDERGPASELGTFVKALFIAQVAVCPPTIVLVVNRPELFSANYKRFLLNRIRENSPFPEVPIKLNVKGREKAKPEDLIEGERERLREEGAKVISVHGRLEKQRIKPVAADEQLGLDDEDFDVKAPVDLDDLSDDAADYFDDDDGNLAEE